MNYQGSKRRVLKEILPIIMPCRRPGQVYVEPFVGGFNVIQNFKNPRIANDFNPYLIHMVAEIQKGWTPPKHVTEEEYLDIKENKRKYPPELVGFAGTCFSFSGQWFGSYAPPEKRNPRRSLLKWKEELKGIKLYSGSYDEFPIPENSLIYCDPPYANSYGYGKERFDSERFWEWCRETSKNHTMFISEYQSPQDFTCIWEKDLVISYHQKHHPTATEKLFIPPGQRKPNKASLF